MKNYTTQLSRSNNNPLIFIVEDDPIYQALIHNELLEHQYANIELFNTGVDAVANFYKNPDIILLDYNLNDGMDGLSVLKQIKAFNPDTQVIMLSAQEKIEVAVNSLKYGGYEYVIKNEAALIRIPALIKKITAWNKMLHDVKKFRQIKWYAGLGIGILTSILLIFNVLFPESIFAF